VVLGRDSLRIISVSPVSIWLRFFRAFSPVVRQMPGWCPQRRGTARTLPSFFVALCIVCVALCIFCFVLCIFCVVLCDVCFVTFIVLFVCICVMNNCHRVATQLQLNISYHISRPHIHSSFTDTEMSVKLYVPAALASGNSPWYPSNRPVWVSVLIWKFAVEINISSRPRVKPRFLSPYCKYKTLSLSFLRACCYIQFLLPTLCTIY
jgi:hypothetical protein